MKKNIMIVTNGSIGIGGLSTISYNLSKLIDRSKFNVFYFFLFKVKNSKYKDEILTRGDKFFEFDSHNKKTSIVTMQKKIIEIIKKNNIEVIHIHSDASYRFLKIIIPTKMCKIKKIILHTHNSNVDGKFNKILHIICKPIINRLGTDFLACSDSAANFTFSKKNVKKTVIIPNGINSMNYKFSVDKRKEYRGKFGFKDKDIVIGTVGRCEEEKNQKFILNFCKKYNTKCIIIGNGSLFNQMNEYIKKNNIEKNCIMLGNVDNVFDYLSCFDYFFLPSLFEGFPIVLVEAQANGLKCLVSEAVTKSTNITGLVKYLKLDNMEIWKNIIDKEQPLNFKERMNINQKIMESNYNLKNIKNIINNLYIGEKIDEN